MLSKIFKPIYTRFSKDFVILGLEYPSSRFKPEKVIPINNTPIRKDYISKQSNKLTEFEKLCGLDFPSSRFE